MLDETRSYIRDFADGARTASDADELVTLTNCDADDREVPRVRQPVDSALLGASVVFPGRRVNATASIRRSKT